MVLCTKPQLVVTLQIESANEYLLPNYNQMGASLMARPPKNLCYATDHGRMFHGKAEDVLSSRIRIQEIAEAASVLIGRPINSQSIRGCLSSMGAEWSEKTGRWTLADTTDENGDEEYATVVKEMLSKNI